MTRRPKGTKEDTISFVYALLLSVLSLFAICLDVDPMPTHTLRDAVKHVMLAVISEAVQR